jgi:hypothetical protein
VTCEGGSIGIVSHFPRSLELELLGLSGKRKEQKETPQKVVISPTKNTFKNVQGSDAWGPEFFLYF